MSKRKFDASKQTRPGPAPVAEVRLTATCSYISGEVHVRICRRVAVMRTYDIAYSVDSTQEYKSASRVE